MIVGAGIIGASTMASASTPAIRLTTDNQVPACVTPTRLDAFLNTQISKRGFALHPRHRNIAKWYRHHGIDQRVRWDYAFFQMALETNFLSFRRSNGKRGDVLPRQNNFAGLGTTGGGVRGDSYPDVSTGVLAQIQHLVVYSGQRLRRPTGHRTRLKQNVILQSVSKIVRQRPVTFADLAGRWAADRRYGRSIRRLANRFYRQYCKNQADASTTSTPPVRRAPARLIPTTVASGRSVRGPSVRKVLQVAQPLRVTAPAYVGARPSAVPTPKPPPSFGRSSASSPHTAASMRTFTPTVPAGPLPTTTEAKNPADCRVQVAGYGGLRAVLIKSQSGSITRLTALNVYPGFEEMMAQSFIKSHAPAGKTIGTFESRKAAVAEAHVLCQRPPAHTGR